MKPSGDPAEDLARELEILITGRDAHDHEKEVPALLALATVKRRARESTASWALLDALIEELNDAFAEEFQDTELDAVRALFALNVTPRHNAAVRRKAAADALRLGPQGVGVTERTFKDRYQHRYLIRTAQRLLERHREASPVEHAQSAADAETAPVAAVDAEKAGLQSESRGEETTADQRGPGWGPAMSSPEQGPRARRTATPSPERSRLARFRTPAGIIILVLAAAFLGATVGNPFGGGEQATDERPAPRQGTAPVERPPPGNLTARVLVAIDRSASMGCPLELAEGERCNRALRDQERRLPLDDQRLTRIGTARKWASRGIAALKRPGDEVAISAYWTSRGKGPRREVLKRKAKPVLRRVAKLGPISGLPNLEDLFGALRATDGGTPLNNMIDQGASDLRVSPTADSINTLVILTDGGRNGSTISLQELRTSLVAAAEAGEPPVRVLITAAGNATCERLRAALAEPGDGDCFRAPTESAVICASRKIRALLRTAQPPTPRSAKQKARDRVCK